jgi:integrase/recombinase XerD
VSPQSAVSRPLASYPNAADAPSRTTSTCGPALLLETSSIDAPSVSPAQFQGTSAAADAAVHPAQPAAAHSMARGPAAESLQPSSLTEGLASSPAAALTANQASTDDQLIELWLHGRSPHTQRAYLSDVLRFRARAGKPLHQVTLSDLQGFADSLEALAPASRYRTLSAVKSLLAFGHRIGYLPLDVGRALRLPAVRKRLAERILPEADLHRILSLEPKPRNRALLTLLYASGVRVSELCGLCWRDLQANNDGGQITVFGKGGVTRAIQLPASVWQLLTGLQNAQAGPDEPVFCSRKGQNSALQPLAVLRVVRQAAQHAGIELPVSPHWLRHAHASHALDRGAPIHLVQATLGHASITTTGRYLHARPNDSSSRFLPI